MIRLSHLGILGDEGLRLFFPLAALHAIVWPLLWTGGHGLGMPVAGQIPPSAWHAGEMLFGTYGAALLGFITTAVPEWTDTPPLRRRPLFLLAGSWGIGRLAGFVGSDLLAVAGGVADILWLGALVVYCAACWRSKPSARLFGPLFWLILLTIAGAVTRSAFMAGSGALAQKGLLISGLLFVGLLGLVLARVTVPVTNMVLDPSRETTPFRPHPGRLNLAPGLVLVAVGGILAGWSQAVTGFLLVAAGAAFLDRMADSFVGRETFRAEILALMGASLLSGLGLILAGAARLGAPLPEIPALHLAFIGGLGLGVLAVFSIASLMHTGRTLPVPRAVPLALGLAVAAVILRTLPPLGLVPWPPGPAHLPAAILWSAAFLVWLRAYWPVLSTPRPEGT
ncbi:NnrS family protein [Magnetospirillum sp. 15-1]|uniref:NnrS family protein n=1 Tax=Magnetospirillum sp. 15-1 TaxID=1979370 RepID=UPI000BBBB55D|nr:NnrS family protein [Magnetospirillum sp. 15-1]